MPRSVTKANIQSQTTLRLRPDPFFYVVSQQAFDFRRNAYQTAKSAPHWDRNAQTVSHVVEVLEDFVVGRCASRYLSRA